jgi:hypothetical protein
MNQPPAKRPGQPPAEQQTPETPSQDHTERLGFPPRAAALLLVGLVVVVGGTFLSRTSKPVASAEVVKTRRAVPAFRVITKEDVLAVRVVAPPPAAIASTRSAIGQVTTTALRRGELLTTRMLVMVGPDRQRWQMLAISTAGSQVVAPGATAVVLGIDADGKVNTISKDALVLGGQGDQVVVALRPGEADHAARYRAEKHQFLVLQPVAASTG